jgi:signal transduction histidine kinase
MTTRRFMDKPKIYPQASPGVSGQSPAFKQSHASLDSKSTRKVHLAWVDAREIVDEVCRALEERLTASRIETTLDVPRQSLVLADHAMLRSAITSLATNAIEAMPDGGRLVITSYSGKQGFELEVADSGPGLSEEGLARAFEPFYTTKHGNAGLGLPVVRRIAQAHHGDVVAANCPEGGAAFTLRFPQKAHVAAA